jgi:hypothetical protein
MPSPRALVPLAVVLLTLSACKGATEVCDPSDPLCSPGGTPSMAIADATVTEGTGGTVNAVFTVTLSAAAGATVTAQYSTATGTAVAPDDFTAVSGTLTIASGLTSGQVIVPVVSDIVGEAASETFTVNLTTPTNATISDGAAVGTITDDDACDPIATLTPGQTVSGALANTDCAWTSATDYFDMYLVTVADTMRLAIDLTSNAQDFDPYLAVFSLGGVDGGQDDDGGYDLNSRQLISASAGTFVVYAGAATSAGEIGDYRLSVTRVPRGVTYYGSTGVTSSTLHTVHPETGVGTLVGSINFNNVGAMGFHPTTKVLYAEAARPADNVRVLISINRTTGAGTEIGPTGVGAAAGLAFRSDGTLFLYSTSHSLYTVSLTTGVATLVGATGNPGNGGNGIAFDAAGTLYHSNRDESHTLNTTTGVASFLANMDFPVPCQTDAVNTNGGRFSGVDRPTGFSQFYGIVKCDSGGSATPTYFGRVDFTTGYAVVIGETADDLDGFAIYTP